MKKIMAISIGLLISVSVLGAPVHHTKNHASAQDDPPNYVSGALNFYNADRDPTSDEPDILSGLLVPEQILQWKNTTNSNLWYLVSATSSNPDGSPILTWVEIYSSGSFKISK